MIEETSLASALRETFPVALQVCIEKEGLLEDRLSAGERETLARFSAPERRSSWLRGRAALKRLLPGIGRPDDSSLVKFPHPEISLSHSGPAAIAVGASGGRLRGLGVDVQFRFPVRPETARRFLNPSELVWLRRLEESERPRAMHRLWTVKEAVFKADPDNAGKTLRDFALADPGFVAGKARRADHVFFYASFEIPDGFISVAVLPAVAPDSGSQ